MSIRYERAPVSVALVRCLLLLLLVGLYVTPIHARDDAAASVGEAIYRRGVLPSGKPLQGDHRNGARRQGADAACMNCHRRSGLGEIEGRTSIPLSPVATSCTRVPNRPRISTCRTLMRFRLDRDPYTDATIARAIRGGLNSEGKPLDDLMPRFALGNEDMSALIGYMKSLDPRRASGVTDTVLHFATIITPDADPVKRKGMLDVLEHYFTEKNAFQRAPLRACARPG